MESGNSASRMKSFFNLLFLLFAALSLPRAWLRARREPAYRGMFRRRSQPPELAPRRPCLWINGVSVGEIASAQPLAAEFERLYPGIRLVFSCTTGTGFARASTLYGARHDVIGYPFDWSFTVAAFLEAVRPDAVIMMELDLWPNFLLACRARGVPVVVAGGRISARSARGYGWVQPLLKAPLQAVRLFLAQDDVDAERALRGLGLPTEKVKVGGNLKFDIALAPGSKLPGFLPQFKGQGRLLVLASTHDPEEDLLLKALGDLGWPNRRYGDWRLAIAPRHPERAGALLRGIAARGLRPVLFSAAENGENVEGGVLLVDRIGVLSSLYTLADLCFIGGSLIPHGGQNMIEPAAHGVAVMFGPYAHNFREAVSVLLEAKAAVQVRGGPEEFEERLSELLQNATLRRDLGDRARAAVSARRGAAKCAAEAVRELLVGAGPDAPT